MGEPLLADMRQHLFSNASVFRVEIWLGEYLGLAGAGQACRNSQEGLASVSSGCQRGRCDGQKAAGQEVLVWQCGEPALEKSSVALLQAKKCRAPFP